MRATLVCFTTFAALSPGAARAARFDLPTLIARAKKNAQVDVARAGAEGARARKDEVSLLWTPHFELTTLGGPSPEIRCNPNTVDCESTTPTEARLGFKGIFFRLDATTTMPLYTFGKISSGTRAAEAGIHVANSMVAVAEAQAALDAARAYYGVKLAREFLIMLKDGGDQLDDELKRIEDQLEKGKGEVTESDRRRLRALRAEVDARMSEARRGEGVALAGVRYFAGQADADVDEAPLAAVEAKLPTREEARAGAAGRPEKKAADAAVVAAEELVSVEKARWLPDFVLAGQTRFARSTSTDDPQNAFYNDPFNASSFTIGVLLRWTLDPFSRPSKIRQARADEKRASATARYANSGLAAEAERAWAEVSDARDRLAASQRGEKEARAWYVATLQAVTGGLAEPKEMADSLLFYFTMRGRVLQATFDWNVGVVQLAHTMGQK